MDPLGESEGNPCARRHRPLLGGEQGDQASASLCRHDMLAQRIEMSAGTETSEKIIKINTMFEKNKPQLPIPGQEGAC